MTCFDSGYGDMGDPEPIGELSPRKPVRVPVRLEDMHTRNSYTKRIPLQAVFTRFVFPYSASPLDNPEMDWKKRARGLMKMNKWTLETVCATYNTIAKHRGMVRIAKDGTKTAHTIGTATLSHWLNGRRDPGISEFTVLAEALEISPGAMIGSPAITAEDRIRMDELLRQLRDNPKFSAHILAFKPSKSKKRDTR